MKRKLQVFVSSTYTDLLVERQAAVAAILKAGHIPAGMELFSAGDRSQLEVIKRWIDASDAYMLILGGRYGSIDPNSGLSYTEFEYDYAVQQGKPLFAAVIEESELEDRLKTLGSSVIETQDTKALNSFRSKVLSNISSFFRDAKDIRLCVHESLADIAENPNAIGWVPASEVEDTRPLHAEIAALKMEIEGLKKDSRQTPVVSKGTLPISEVTELRETLRTTMIPLPQSVATEAVKERDALSLFLNNRDVLITGVTNAYNSNEAEDFFYLRVAPKLMVHGLMANEKVAGVKYRRSYVTDKGLKFLAAVDKIKKDTADK